MPIADILSRAYLSDCNGKRGQFPQINGIKHLPATDAYITMQALKKNTEWLTGKQGRCERIHIVVFCRERRASSARWTPLQRRT